MEVKHLMNGQSSATAGTEPASDSGVCEPLLIQGEPCPQRKAGCTAAEEASNYTEKTEALKKTVYAKV